MITEKLVINGPYSEDIGPNVFKREYEDEVILCLNYDGKFGLNNMNNYFQAANTQSAAVSWAEWTYKIGDPILFNDSKRFDLLYNNLKGRIVNIERSSNSISFMELSVSSTISSSSPPVIGVSGSWGCSDAFEPKFTVRLVPSADFITE